MGIPLNIDWQQILLHLFNFVILVGGLYFLLYEPVKRFMHERVEYYAKQEEHANQELEQAQAANAAYQKKIEQVDAEILEQKSQAMKEAIAQAEKMVLEAKEEKERILAEAKAAGEKEKRKVIDQSREEIVNLAMEATEKLLKERQGAAKATDREA